MSACTRCEDPSQVAVGSSCTDKCSPGTYLRDGICYGKLRSGSMIAGPASRTSLRIAVDRPLDILLVLLSVLSSVALEMVMMQ